MKALILAAGFGTRLKPHTDRLPKPLFPIDGTPILELAIQRLISAGCTGIVINTHHLHDQIEDYIGGRSYPVPVTTCYEPVILDTGGAIRNVRTLLGDAPFLVINSDIVTDLDYAQVYDAHLQHPHPVTLVLHDCPEFNNVTCDPEGFVLGFHLTEKPLNTVPDLAFTGIQVLDPSVIELIPGDGPYSSIDLYRQLIARGPSVKSLVVRNHYWIDIGSPAKYATACRDLTAPRIFRETFGIDPGMDFAVTHLSGDGSDRAFYRLQTDDRSMILSDHGITLNPERTEASSFVRIGIHLRSRDLPVPRILGWDLISGHVYLEDLGDTHLETVARQSSPSVVYDLYRKVTHALAHLSVEGFKGFRPEFTYQTEVYDAPMIVEKECLYFLNAFVKGVLGRQIPPDSLMDEFSHLALKAVENGYIGFMHRDFQSRNIMVKNDTCYFIDFQGGRTGPVQYDLASLLIDPYVDLTPELQDTLLDDFMDDYGTLIPLNRSKFVAGYNHLRITRNLQMLGAFGFLSRVKGKSRFADYIPTAVKNLKRNMEKIDVTPLKQLKHIVDSIQV